MPDKSSTQSFIPVREIKSGVIIRDDGIMCGVILVSSINFSLKSQDEQDAVLYNFQSMLNALEVSTQILVQSRRLNIRPYIKYLENLHSNQTIELLKLQTREYIAFIKEFTDNTDIMSKRFFVIVTYTPINLSVPIKSIFGKEIDKNKKEKSFEENKSQLLQRVNFVQSNLRSLGLRTQQLSTEEIVELLYQTFNPGDTQTPPLEVSS